MEENTWHPPVWKRWYDNSVNPVEVQTACIRVPDFSNVGPIVATYRDDSGSSNIASHDETMASAAQKQKYGFTRMKDISQRFPLEKSKKFAYPLTKPKDVMKPYRYVALNNFLWRQGGNALDLIELQGKTYIVHPSCGSLPGGIIITEMLPGTFEDTEETNESLFYHLRHHSRLARRSTNEIYQLIAKEINGTGYVLIRTKYTAHFYSLNDKLMMNKTLNVSHYVDSDIITSVALSDTLPGCFATACAHGLVSVYDDPNPKSMKPIWENQFSGQDRCVYQCEFGRQAFSSLVVNNRSAVWHCDTRSKPVNIGDGSAQTLFDLDTMKHFIHSLDIISKVARTGWHYLYVVTSNSILLMDERYCKIPAMKWDHTIQSPPSFLTQTKIKDLEVCMVGNSHDFRVGAVSYKCNTKQACVSRTGLPWYFDIVRDTMQFAHERNIWFDHQINCVGNCFKGLATCVNPNKESSLCLLALNESGDIFLQDFHISDDDINFFEDAAVTNSCDEVGKKLLQTWEKKAIDLAVKQSDRARQNRFLDIDDMTDSEDTDTVDFSGKPYNLASYYSELEKSFNSKEMNLKGNRMLWRLQNFVVSNFTTAGNGDLDLVMNDDSDFKKGLEKYIPDDLSHHIKPDFYEKNCTDNVSRSILKVWQNTIESEGKDLGGPSVVYRSAPFDIDRVLVLPKKLKLQCTDDFVSVKAEVPNSFSPLQNSNSLLHASQMSAESKNKKRKLKKRIDGF